MSTVTVSNAFAGRKGVSEEVRSQVVAKAKELGYDLKKYTNKRQGFTIGVIVSEQCLELGVSFYWSMYQKVAYAASKSQSVTMLEALGQENEEKGLNIKKYCISKHKAYEDYPFGDVPICYKLNGKVFAQIYPYPEDYKITLKCTADAGQFYRMVYPGKVVRGYHCPPVQQPYWNTIYLDDFPDGELLNMIDHAYETVFNGFSKKVQKQILEEA